MFLIKYHKHETSMDTIQYLVVYSVAYSFQHSALVKVLSDFKQKKWSSHLIYQISNSSKHHKQGYIRQNKHSQHWHLSKFLEFVSRTCEF